MGRLGAYFLTMLWGAAPALILWCCARPWRRRQLEYAGLCSGKAREAALALFWMFCGGMATVALLPRWVVWAFVDLMNGYRWNGAGYPFFSLGNVNLRLFRTFHADAHSIFILAGNVIMFVPFGFFAALLWRGFTWKRALSVGLGITGFIECCQLFVGRTFDIDDILLNTLGVFCGYLLWRLLKRLAPKFTEEFHVYGNSAID